MNFGVEPVFFLWVAGKAAAPPVQQLTETVTIIMELAVVVGIAGLGLLAQLAVQYHWARWLKLGLLWLLGILLAGAALLLNTGVAIHLANPKHTVANPQELPTALLVTLIAVLVLAVLIPPTRRWLFHLLPGVEHSPPHQLGVILTLLFGGYFLLDLLVFYDVEKVIALMEKASPEYMALSIVISQAGLLTLCAAGSGLFLRRRWKECLERLGLRALNQRAWLETLGIGLAFFTFSATLDQLVLKPFFPQSYENLNRIAQAALPPVSDPVSLILLGLFLAILPAVCEELFFRGLLQPVLGILPTAFFFTIMHTYYGISPALGLLFVLALVLGWVRERHGLLACMGIHFLNNFLATVATPLLVSGGK